MKYPIIRFKKGTWYPLSSTSSKRKRNEPIHIILKKPPNKLYIGFKLKRHIYPNLIFKVVISQRANYGERRPCPAKFSASRRRKSMCGLCRRFKFKPDNLGDMARPNNANQFWFSNYVPQTSHVCMCVWRRCVFIIV